MAIEKNTPPWHLSASQYCIQQGVKQPYICEISPMQMGLMGKRKLEAYMRERGAQWEASAACKLEWRSKVYAAFRAGEFDWRDPPASLHPEALSALVLAVVEVEKVAKDDAWRAFGLANRIWAPSDVSEGDRVYDIMCRGYVRVVKTFAKGIRTVPETPRYQGDAMKPSTRPAQMFNRLSYNDAKEAFEAAYNAPG